MFNFFSKSKKSKAKRKSGRKSSNKSVKKSGTKTAKSTAVRTKSATPKSGALPASSDPATRLAQLIVANEIDGDINAPAPEPAPVNAAAKLDAAKAALDSGKSKSKLAPSDRQKLIRQALAIQQVQSKLLDDIDDETRRKLQGLAVDTLFPGRK